MLQISKTITARVVPPVPTCLFVEHDLILELLALLQRAADAEDDALAGLQPVQELAGAALLHDLAPGEAGELAEAIGAVDDGEALGHLSVGQDEVAICRGWREEKKRATVRRESERFFSRGAGVGTTSVAAHPNS